MSGQFFKTAILPLPLTPKAYARFCNVGTTHGMFWWQNKAMCSQLSSIQYGLCWQCLAHVWMGNGAEAWNAGFYCLKYWVPILHTLTFKVEDHALNCFQFYKFVSIITMELSLKFLVCSTNCFNLCLQARMGFVAEIIVQHWCIMCDWFFLCFYCLLCLHSPCGRRLQEINRCWKSSH